MTSNMSDIKLELEHVKSELALAKAQLELMRDQRDEARAQRYDAEHRMAVFADESMPALMHAWVKSRASERKLRDLLHENAVNNALLLDDYMYNLGMERKARSEPNVDFGMLIRDTKEGMMLIQRALKAVEPA